MEREGKYFDYTHLALSKSKKNIPKELKPKVSKEINLFVKKYTLKRRLSATSFYVFEGEEREKIVEMLKVFS